MEGSKQLILLILGLCLVLGYVNTERREEEDAEEKIHVYGNEFRDPREKMADQLKHFRQMEEQLEVALKTTPETYLDRSTLEVNLYLVKKAIAHIEKTSTVSYADYQRIKERQRANFAKNIDQFRKKLARAKNEEEAEKIAEFEKNIAAMNAEKEAIEKEMAEFVRASELNLKRLKNINDSLKKDTEEIENSLQEANKNQARAFKAVSERALLPSPSRFHIPQQDRINELKHNLKQFLSMKEGKLQIKGLLQTLTKISALLPGLQEAGKFSPESSRNDLVDAITLMEINTAMVKEEQNKKRKEIVDTIKNTDLLELGDEKIKPLEKINEELAATDMFEQEVTTRSAYLKGLLEVYDLIEECSNAIEASQKGKIATFLREAIDEAKKGNLSKLWMRS